MRLIVLISLLPFSSFAGDLILKDPDQKIMVAIKTEDIGNKRTRLVAWMNAQHKSGHYSCRLAGSIKMTDSKTVNLQRHIDLFPGENIPLHLGNFGRDFDPSKDVVAKVDCQEITFFKGSKKRSGTTRCCQLGSNYTSFCASTEDDDGVVISADDIEIDLVKRKKIESFPPCG